MSLQSQVITRLKKSVPGGYLPGGPPASEPVAWSAIALSRYGELGAARRAADWLSDCQQHDGSVGVAADQPTPAWPTGLAVLAWNEVNAITSSGRYTAQAERAVDWALGAKGRTAERKKQIGHDTTLVGWSWAADTHSWLEPTSMFVAALRRAGRQSHARVAEGLRLLEDRLLPSGGCNYGNTLVLGQELLPHVQPTGLVLWALAGRTAQDQRLVRAIEYLEKSLGPKTTTASLAYGLMGLEAQGRRPAQADQWLAGAAERELAGRPSPYKLSLLAVAMSASPAARLANVAD